MVSTPVDSWDGVVIGGSLSNPSREGDGPVRSSGDAVHRTVWTEKADAKGSRQFKIQSLENLSRCAWDGSVIRLSIANSPPFGGKTTRATVKRLMMLRENSVSAWTQLAKRTTGEATRSVR
jgi:hypothetical protein